MSTSIVHRPEPASPVRFLHHLNPIAKLLGPLLAIMVTIFVKDLATPIILTGIAMLMILIGARFTRFVAIYFVAVLIFLPVSTLTFSLWVDTSRVADLTPVLQIGDWTLTRGALLVGLATALRLITVASLAMISSLTTFAPDFVRAAVQQLKVPYRIGYTALTAFRFIPRFGHDLAVIRAAHRVRGVARGRGPISAIRRMFSYPVPLLASGIRHAERVALAMDARAFGAHATRTERHIIPFRTRDWVFVILWVALGILVPFWIGPALAPLLPTP